MYHQCGPLDSASDGFSVSQEMFRAQMEYLHHNGFVGVSLQRLFAEQEYIKGEASATGKGAVHPEELTGDTRKKVVLTFDDGDKSHFDSVFPVLKSLGFTATFFVTVNDIGKEGRMDWTMIYDLSKNGMDIGSHGMSHSFFPGQASYVVLNEFLLSKQILEKYTRKRVNFISIPHGFYNKQILTIARDAGFKSVCVSDAGYIQMDNDLFLVKRFTVRRKYAMAAFRSIVAGNPGFFLNLMENIRSFLRHALGYQVYDRACKLAGKQAVKQ